MLFIMKRIYYNYFVFQPKDAIERELFGEQNNHKYCTYIYNGKDYSNIIPKNIVELIEKRIYFTKYINTNLIPADVYITFSRRFLAKFPINILKKRMV